MVKYALSYLFAQSEFGLLCPVNMTDSCARMLDAYGSDELRARYLPHLTATDPAELWQGTQWMTERTGGSDVGASTTVARRDADGQWRLWGDKWFTSVANAELAPHARPARRSARRHARARDVPGAPAPARRQPERVDDQPAEGQARLALDGHRRGDLRGARAWVVGELGSGFKQMMEMVNGSRLSNAMRAAGLMRRGLLESLVHARQRIAFGHPLIELPLLRSNLLSMLLDAEAAASVILNGAALLDRRDAGDAEARALARVWTPLAKYWITLRARDVTAEAMNVRGGNGYVEEWVNPRLLRDAYLGAIWEGSANVVALDVQRAILKDRGLEALADLRRRAARAGRRSRPPSRWWTWPARPWRRSRARPRAGPRGPPRSGSWPRGRWPTRSTICWPARCCSPRARPCASRGRVSGSSCPPGSTSSGGSSRAAPRARPSPRGRSSGSSRWPSGGASRSRRWPIWRPEAR